MEIIFMRMRSRPKQHLGGAFNINKKPKLDQKPFHHFDNYQITVRSFILFQRTNYTFHLEIINLQDHKLFVEEADINSLKLFFGHKSNPRYIIFLYLITKDYYSTGHVLSLLHLISVLNAKQHEEKGKIVQSIPTPILRDLSDQTCIKEFLLKHSKVFLTNAADMAVLLFYYKDTLTILLTGYQDWPSWGSTHRAAQRIPRWRIGDSLHFGVPDRCHCGP